jgi:hypothetical protein
MVVGLISLGMRMSLPEQAKELEERYSRSGHFDRIAASQRSAASCPAAVLQ